MFLFVYFSLSLSLSHSLFVDAFSIWSFIFLGGPWRWRQWIFVRYEDGLVWCIMYQGIPVTFEE